MSRESERALPGLGCGPLAIPILFEGAPPSQKRFGAKSRETKTMISAVVLAAGMAEGMAKPNLLLALRGKPVLQRVIESLLSSSVNEVICVARRLAGVREFDSIPGDRLFWLLNNAADIGQSGSVIGGLWAVDPRAEGALFVPGGQAMLGRDLIDALIERFHRVPAWIVAPSFNGQIKKPVLIRRELFPELLLLRGNSGIHEVIEKNRDLLELIPWHEEAPFVDLDDQEYYERSTLLT